LATPSVRVGRAGRCGAVMRAVRAPARCQSGAGSDPKRTSVSG